MKTGQKNMVDAPFIAPEAYNFCVFATLNEDDIVELERDLKKRDSGSIPLVFND